MSNLIDEKGVSHLLIDSFLKAVRDNTIGNPGGNPDQVVSVGFSNVYSPAINWLGLVLNNSGWESHCLQMNS